MTRTDNNNNRRNLFRRLSGRDDVRRPPWSRASFLDLCTGCNACIDAVLLRGCVVASSVLRVAVYRVEGTDRGSGSASPARLPYISRHT